jgi:acyl dehydratase
MPTGCAASHTTTPTRSLPTSERAGQGADAVAGAKRGWYLEDAIPGTTIRHRGGRTIADGEHVWLAWVTHNVSDLHGNADSASRTEWGQPLVLGMLTAAIVIGLAAPADGPPETVADTWPDGWETLRLEQPVMAADSIRAESLIEAVATVPGAPYGRVTRTIIGRNQRTETVVRIQEERNILRRPPHTPTAPSGGG